MLIDYNDVIAMTLVQQQINAKKTTDEIMQLFAQYGNSDYDGEPVTQTSHMIQCAMLAMQANADQELVLGAFLHDIGHLLGHKLQAGEMGGFGAINHEGIGAEYLKEKCFGERICAVVEGHVAAKRYLVATDENYAARLSSASRETLRWQGGAMSGEEVMVFRQQPYFTEIIQVRLWDEGAKDYDAVLLPLNLFKNFIEDYLSHKS